MRVAKHKGRRSVKLSWTIYLLIAFITLLLISTSYFLIKGIRGYYVNYQHKEFKDTAYRYNREFQHSFLHSKILGTTASIGLINPEIKSFSANPTKALLKNVNCNLEKIRNHYSASIVYLMNRKGTVIASTSDKLYGKNYKFRPYFIKAINGHSVVYPALGVTTKKRGLYFASPIFSSHKNDEKESIVGVIVVKVGLENVDAFLEKINGLAMLISPDGVIFATNKQEWLFRTIYPMNTDKFNEIKKSKQFSDKLATQIAVVPFDFHDNEVVLNNKHFFFYSARLPLADEFGHWNFVYMWEIQLSNCNIITFITVGVLVIFYIFAVILLITTSISQQMKRNAIEADIANKLKSEFLANMSHEIRTPMNSILGFTSLLLESHIDESQKRALSLIRQSAKTLLELINDILDLSKVEAGKVELHESPVDLYCLIFEVCNTVIGKKDNKDVDLLCDIECYELPRFLVDEKKITQILVNLIGNAIKFTKQGEIVVRLKVLEEYGDKMRFCIEVEDTGIGIPEEKLESIFAPFTQVDISSTRNYEGTGLGLTLSRKLTQLMKGELVATSIEGCGSCFKLTLELEKVTNEIENDIIQKNAFKDVDALIVDDNNTAAEILVKMLKKMGINAYSVGTIKEAEKLLAGSSSKYIFFNSSSFGERGEFFVENARKYHVDDNSCFIAMVNESIVSKNNVNKVIDGALQKPIDIFSLYELLQVLQKRRNDNTGENIDEESRKSDNQKLKTLKVLVAEDNLINQELNYEVFKSLGIESVEMVRNGKDVIDKASSSRYDIIFLDIRLPGMDGLQIANKIREMKVESPIIAMTASAMKGDRTLCLNSGMNDYLSKPFEKGDLAKIVKKWALRKESG